MSLIVHQFLCLTDNYGVLLHDSGTGATASVDAPDAEPILASLAERGWTLTDILVTHHHADHTQGIPKLKERFPAARVSGPAREADRIPAIELQLKEGDFVAVGSTKARVIETPGHTLGHIAYYFGEEEIAFCGDTIFALGCGRCFETPYPVLWDSLMKIARLPGETHLYCGHEYTQANAKFAMTIESGNPLLVERVKDIARLREAGKPTLPTTVAAELATNPFLRAEEPAVQAAVGMANADAGDVFTELRLRKDRF